MTLTALARSPLDDSVPLLTSNDLQRLLRVGDRTLRRWVDAGRLPAPVRLGRARRWQADVIRDWLSLLAPARA